MRPYFLLLALSPSLLLAACGGSTDSSNAQSSAGGESNAGAGGSSVSLGGAGGSANGGSTAAGKGGTTSLGMGGSATAGTGGSAAAGKGGSTPSTGGSSSAGTGGAPVGAGGMTPAGAGGEPTGGGGQTTGGGGTTAGTGGSPVGAGGASAGAGGADAGAGGSSAGSAGAGPCPSTPPTAGTPCVAPSSNQIPGAQCTYGDNVVGNCREQFSCENGMWQDQSTDSICPSPGSMGCPMTAPTVGDMCTADGTTCGFPDGTICDCSACDGDVCMPNQQTTWHCVGPNTQPNCPMIVPNAGTPCSATQSNLCTYGGCGGEGAMCTNGYWNWELLLCG